MCLHCVTPPLYLRASIPYYMAQVITKTVCGTSSNEKEQDYHWSSEEASVHERNALYGEETYNLYTNNDGVNIVDYQVYHDMNRDYDWNRCKRKLY